MRSKCEEEKGSLFPIDETRGPLLWIKVGLNTKDRKKDQASRQESQDIDVLALLDTGTNLTCIDTRIVKEVGKRLDFLSGDKAKLRAWIGGRNSEEKLFLVRLSLPIGVGGQDRIFDWMVTSWEYFEEGGPMCLIGRDILDHGIFAYYGYKKQFSLCIPDDCWEKVLDQCPWLIDE